MTISMINTKCYHKILHKLSTFANVSEEAQTLPLLGLEAHVNIR